MSGVGRTRRKLGGGNYGRVCRLSSNEFVRLLSEKLELDRSSIWNAAFTKVVGGMVRFTRATNSNIAY